VLQQCSCYCSRSVQARFESGNLKSAIRVGECEYDCTLRNDMFTDGHTQWFNFCV
jgi:hypothetical protein